MEGIQVRKKILLGVLLLTSIILLLFFYSGLRSNRQELVVVDNRNYEINLYPTDQEGVLNLRDKLYYIVGGDIEKLYDSEGNPLTNYNVDLSKRPEVFYLEYQRLGIINERYKININYGDNYLALYIDGELVDNIPKTKIDSIEDLPNYTWFVDNEYTEIFNLDDLATQNAIGTRNLDEKVTVNYTVNYLYENTNVKIENLNSITNEGKVGDVVEITHPTVLGYIPTTTSPTSYKLVKGTNVVNVYYKVDKTQTFSYTINYLIKDTNTSLSPKLEGMHYVGNVELTHPTVLGYKLVSNQPNEVIIKAGVANNLNIYYEVDETQNNFPVEVTFKVTDPVTNQTKEVTKTLTGYVGEEIEIPFLALDIIGMSQVIEHDKEIESNSISIYNSFYNFFTGFFPEYVVNEYHGIFTFIVVAFLLFLVFGFVFFLFRVIRRLVGFK